MKGGWIAALAALFVVASPCRAEEWPWPPGIAPPRIPSDNPMSTAKVDLGRVLFHDSRLSGNGTVSCASCHLEAKGFSDGRPLSIGATGETTPRNAPGLINLAWMATLTWANPALVSLERQMEVPLFGENPVEMGIDDRNAPEVLARFRADPEMRRRFAEAFPGLAEPIGFGSIIKAIAAFERSLVAFGSRFDRGGPLSAEERRGMALFFGERGRCHECHGGIAFADQGASAETPFHDIGYRPQGGLHFPNRGLFEFSGRPEDFARFRAPPLRNATLTAPYLHDGGAATLDEAITAHAGLDLDAAERSGIAAFLATLGE